MDNKSSCAHQTINMNVTTWKPSEQMNALLKKAGSHKLDWVAPSKENKKKKDGTRHDWFLPLHPLPGSQQIDLACVASRHCLAPTIVMTALGHDHH